MAATIIIGSGLAGYTVAREFRKLDKTASLIIITADDGGFYSKPMLSNAFAQRKLPAQLVTQTAVQMAEQVGAHIMTGTRVESIDTAGKTIVTSAGAFEYAKLVIAVGAQPIRLSIAGNAAAEVLSVNHVDDYSVFRSKIAEIAEALPRRVTILGAGLIGCEFADDLAGAGHEIALVDPNSLPLAALAPPALSEGLRAALEKRGIALHLGTTAASVDRSDDGLQVTLADGKTIATDVVLSAVGLRADLRLAQAAQLETGRGIIVDATGQTSAPDVYAVGDCAEYTLPADGSTRHLPYIAPLMTAARAIARTLSGETTAIGLKPAPVIVKTPSYPLALVPPTPQEAASGTWQTMTDAQQHTVCRFYDRDGIMQGFGVAPQDAAIRQSLLAELGTTMESRQPAVPG